MKNVIYTDDIKECHATIRELKKDIKELKEKVKLKNSNKNYYKDLYEEEKRHNNELKKKIECLKYKIKYGNNELQSFDPINSGIYRIYNIKTGESYVGQSSVNVWARALSHFNYPNYKNKVDWHNDLHNNPDDYKWEVIVSGVKDQRILDKLEIYYIGYYDCLDHGYNKQIGGKYSDAYNYIKK